MTYKLKDTDKIEVEAGWLRELVYDLDCEPTSIDVSERIRQQYPAAFEEPEDGWEDVTDRIFTWSLNMKPQRRRRNDNF